MKALLAVNYPLAWADGGFSVQVRQSMMALKRLGVDGEYLDLYREIPQSADILHYFGIPASLTTCRAARARGIKIVSTILAPAGFIRPGGKDYISRAVRDLVVTGLGRERLHGSMGIGLDVADAVISINQAEQNYLRFHHRLDARRCPVISNGVDDVFFDEYVEPEAVDGLFYPSYICPRKNQVEIARAAKQRQVKVVFAGGAQGEYPAYFEQFQQELDGEYATWIGEVRDRRRLAALYRGSLGTFMASDFDNQGLILLESMACGKLAMGPDLPSLRTYFGEHIDYCPSAKASAFPATLQQFQQRCLTGSQPTMKVPSWLDIGRQIVKVYEQVL